MSDLRAEEMKAWSVISYERVLRVEARAHSYTSPVAGEEGQRSTSIALVTGRERDERETFMRPDEVDALIAALTAAVAQSRLWRSGDDE